MGESVDRVLEAEAAIEELAEELAVARSRSKLLDEARAALRAAVAALTERIEEVRAAEARIDQIAKGATAFHNQLSLQLKQNTEDQAKRLDHQFQELWRASAEHQRVLEEKLLTQIRLAADSARQAFTAGADLLRTSAASMNEAGALSLELTDTRRRASEQEVRETVRRALASVETSTTHAQQALAQVAEASARALSAMNAAAARAASFGKAAERHDRRQKALVWLLIAQFAIQAALVTYLVLR